MRYRSLAECVRDLERQNQLVRVTEEVDPVLEIAEIQRRVYRAQGPALYYERVKGCRFPVVSNLFGTPSRCRLMFRSTLDRVRRIVQLKADPTHAWRAPWTFATAPLTAWRSLPRRVQGGPVLAQTAALTDLPQIQSWPDDGGPFITLPQVYSEHPDAPDVMTSNLGMYRIQLAGGQYERGREAGFHYQIHRGVGVHHAAAIRRGEPLRLSIFVGGPPAHTLAAVMPLPEGLSELLFAGMLAGRRFRYARRNGYLISTDADFCITGTVDPSRTLPEGPFGDHLGYYSLAHPFPVLTVDHVYHRRDAVWPFTVVGRPPQEDTAFGALIHDLTQPMVPVELPGIHAIHAVDASGVHPLLLAIGSERYVAYEERMPRELLTQANMLLGFGQCSLAKYLVMVARDDDPQLDVREVGAVLRHALERVNWTRDLHFQTRTTIDTLDYSGTGLNTGSKLVIAAAGPPRRRLATRAPTDLPLPDGFSGASLAMPGILVAGAPRFTSQRKADAEMARLSEGLSQATGLDGVPLIVVVDDPAFAAASIGNFLWVTFTRSNPSHDVHGMDSFIDYKHWGCRGCLIIDARLKSHHAPPLVEDPEVTRRVDALAAKGKSLHGII